jgi:hypothetical protein
VSTKRKKKPAKRVGYVELTVRYAVDLDDKDMVQQAQDCIFDDVCNMVKYDEIGAWIKVGKAAPKLRKSDIPDFLLEDADERQRREDDKTEDLRRDKKRGLYPAEADDAN